MGKKLSKLTKEEQYEQRRLYRRYRLGHDVQYEYASDGYNKIGEITRESVLEFYRRNRLNGIRNRCKKAGIPFNLTIEDIDIPDRCPALGIPLEPTYNTDTRCISKENTPSVDRIVPELGYVKGNIVIVSKKANTMKSNGSWQDLQKLADFYKKLDSSRNSTDNNA